MTTMSAEAVVAGLTDGQKAQYREQGWVVVERLFTADECDALVAHMDDVHAGRVTMGGFKPPAPDAPHAIDVDQVHIYDQTCLEFLRHPKLEAPLRDCLANDIWGVSCGEPEGIKSHYWWKGSEWSQGWHTDGTALPGCMGVWIPLVDVNEEIGTLRLHTGSHALPSGLRIEHDDLRVEGKWAGQRTHSGDGELRAQLTAQIIKENEALGNSPVTITAPKGSAVFFSGQLQHRGVFGVDPQARRDVIASHYISSEYRNWPHVLWERVGFDGVRRWSTGAEDTPAAAANARLPRHPAMELGDNGTVPAITTPPSLLPCRRDAALQILTEEQRNEMDYRGFTVIEDAFDVEYLAALRNEIDVLEANQNLPGDGAGTSPDEGLRTRSGAQIRNISEAEAITFTSGIVTKSILAREFCSSEVFQRICHDVLNVPNVRLYHDQAVYKKPCPGRTFPFHQDNGYTFIDPLQYLTCWVALNDANEANGAPWFIPALHRRGPLEHDFDEQNGGWTIPGIRDDDAVCVPVKAGDIACFWSLTPHMTGPNETDDVRKAYIVQFAPDGWNNQIWDKRGAGGRGIATGNAGPSAVDEGRQYHILCNCEGVAAPPLGPRL